MRNDLKLTMEAYIEQFAGHVHELGKYDRSPGDKDFQTQLEEVKQQSRKYFNLCVVLLLVFFLITSVVGLVFLSKMGTVEGITMRTVFGATAGTVVIWMIRLCRDQNRANFLLVALAEVREIDEKAFANLVTALAYEWYGSKKATTTRFA